MPIGISEEHEELRRAVRRFLETECPPSVVRAAIDAPLEVPAFWAALQSTGWLGLHIAEEHGGSGYGFVELAVVLEEFGRAVAPGPFVPTVLAGALIERGGCENTAVVSELLEGSGFGVVLQQGPGGSITGPVLSATAGAPLVRDDGASGWGVLRGGASVNSIGDGSVDVTRPLAMLALDGDQVVEPLPLLTTERVHEIAAVILGAEAIGIAQWCLETAAQHAKDRVQFGRPIGQFQGVKHKCADMVARTELARAAVWDAARGVDDVDNGAGVAIAAAAALSIEAAFENAKDCVQILGGIGFTWEHDAHLYLRRAMALRALVGTPSSWRQRAARLALRERRRLAVDLGAEAESLRDEVRSFLASIEGLDATAARARMVDEGYITPGWTTPWGRDAGALELLVIDEEFRAAKVARPGIMVGAWALPNLIVHGTAEQQDRWILPTLRGEITWCQLFSEPGAGSDLASLSTRAERVDGGWIVNGQKVWSTVANIADWGILLARTNPDAPKHDGISCFMLDMKTAGVDPRPLRELTGQSLFNEVFFDDVFIPDDCLVGKEHDGWRCARTTLANERVFMGGNSTVGSAVAGLLKLIESSGAIDDSATADLVGGLVVTGHALAVLGFRLTLSALGGADPSGSEAAVRKLLGVQHDQRTQEVGMDVVGPTALCVDGEHAAWAAAFLFNRCLTIAGGTTEVQKNVIAERLLGLPRDP